MKLLKEFKEFEYEVLKEGLDSNGSPGKLIVKGIIQRADTLNQNGRIYPKDILFREVENYRKLVAERRALGELDHCLKGEVEVLTNDGWKQIKDIADNEVVYSLNLETNKITKERIQKKICLPYKGKMLRLFNGKTLDISMTPNHKVLLWDRYHNPYYLSAEEVYNQWKNNSSTLSHSYFRYDGDWENTDTKPCYRIPNTDIEVPFKAFAGMFGLWIAEGCATTQNRVQISQTNAKNIEPIRNLLNETGMGWIESVNGDRHFWTLCSETYWKFFSQFGKTQEKYIPQEYLNWSKECLEELHKWLLIGDGRNRHSHLTGRLVLEYTTISPKLAENVAELQFKLGYRPYIKTHQPNKSVYIDGREILAENCKTQYTVSANVSKTWLKCSAIQFEEEDFEGDVYCVRTRNGNFLIRSNGYVVWTGNCDESVVNLKNVSHLVSDIWTEGNNVMAKIELLTTPMGNIARTLVESNVKLGISSRALGSVNSRGDADVVAEDLHLICFDLVSEPSTVQAWLVREAKEVDPTMIKKIFNKSDRIDRVVNEILKNKK